MKTKFGSYSNGGIADGCKFCLRGEKVVLFMGGKCSRNCWYCSLSNSRKKCKKFYANERPINRNADLTKEIIESNAKGMGITGGDPLVHFGRVLKFSRDAKKKFGSNFHIHIYLPLNLVTTEKIKKLSKYINEFRFHPSFLINKDKVWEEKEKIKKVSGVVGKNRVGVELPLIPGKENEIVDFISGVKDFISFLNLNEFEISETNFNLVTRKYKINEDTCTISGSKDIGVEILQRLKNSGLKIHLCTAKTKDKYQYINRLKRHIILLFGNKMPDGNVVYFAVYSKSLRRIEMQVKRFTKNYYVDKKRKRVIIKMSDVEKVYYGTGLKIARVLEPPTYNADYLEFSLVGSN